MFIFCCSGDPLPEEEASFQRWHLKALKALKGSARGRWLSAIAAGALLGAVLLLLAPLRSPAVQQPIRFNHQVHVKKEPCTTCHRTVLTRETAGRPDLTLCLECHTNPVTQSPEEEKLRQLAREQRPLRWGRLYRVPTHVRFSHQRHVVVGKVECEACHGDIAGTTAPPPRPLVKIRMEFCLDCHRAPGLRLTGASLRALREGAMEAGRMERLLPLENKRFRSGRELSQALQRLAPGTFPEREVEAIRAQLRPAGPVSTDCIACHR